jgi:hypothetical protein
MRLIVVTTFDCDLGPRGVADGQSMQPERILPDGCERRFLREVGLGPKMLDGLRSLYRIRRDYISHRYTQISVADICY